MPNPTSLYSPEAARGWIPWWWLVWALCLLFIVVPMIAGSIPIELAGLSDEHGDPVGVAGLAAMLVLPFSLVLATVLGWVRFVERRSLATIGLVPGRIARRFGLGLAIGIATIAVVVAAIALAGAYTVGTWLPAFTEASALLGIVILLPCFVLQSSVEEIVIRGWLLSAIARRANVAIAVVVSSAVFSLLHLVPDQPLLVTINTFVFGLFAAAWALHSGHVWGVMGWHAGWNWLLATGFELPVTGIDAGLPALVVELLPRGTDFWTGGAQGPEGSVVCTVFFAAAAVGLFVARARRTAASNL